MKKEIEISIIPDKKQRYNTVGDYYETKKKWKIKVSDLPGWKFEALIAIHELVEFMLCHDRKIDFREVDEFDMAFDAKRGKNNADEPGDEPDAPYYKEHQFSTKVEKMLAKELKVNWKEYVLAQGKLMKK